jgi:hypothetical protein
MINGMAVQIIKDNDKLTDDAINNSYVMYLHKFIDTNSSLHKGNTKDNYAIMSYDEFKEYYILNILGRSSEFTENIARDYQYLSFENCSQLPI